jgi:hypothetical protein
MNLFKENIDGTPVFIVSSRNDSLPFRVCIKTGDKEPRHAIVTDMETEERALGKFLFSADYPENPEDIEKYGQDQDIPSDMRGAIFEGAFEQSNRFDVLVNNWEAINTVWYAFNVLPFQTW